MSHFKFQDCRDELSVYIWYSRRHEHYWSFRGCFSRLACRWVVPPDHLLLRKPRGPWELQGKWPRSKTDWLRLSMEACSKKTCTQNALFSNMPQMGQTFRFCFLQLPTKLLKAERLSGALVHPMPAWWASFPPPLRLLDPMLVDRGGKNSA